MPGKKLTGTLLGCAVALACAAPVPAGAAPAWLAPADLSAPGRDASNPVVAMDGAGDTVAAWERQSTTGPGHIVQIATRAAGGGFSAPALLGEAATKPEVAMTPGGEAIVAWWHFANPPGVSVLEVESRPPGQGSFSAPVPVVALPLGVIPGPAQLAVNATGDVVLAWTSRDPASIVDPAANLVEASVRPAGGAFATPEVVSPPTAVAGERSVVGGATIDPAGEATVVWEHETAERVVVEAASRPPGGPFSGPVEVTPTVASGDAAFAPVVASDGPGRATVVWESETGSEYAVEAADREGSGFASPSTLSEPPQTPFQPQVAAAPGGETTVIWEYSGTTEIVVQAARRGTPGASFAQPVDVSTPGGEVIAPVLAVAPQTGESFVAWCEKAGTEQVVEAAIAKPGGGFSTPQPISTSSPEFMRPAVTGDGSGDATVLWPRSNGTNDIVQYAGFDAYAPQLRSLSVPATGTVGVPVAFSVAPFDVWPLPAARFSFGDGAVAGGNAVSHTYGRPGTYLVAVEVTDGAGTTSGATGTIEIRPSSDFKIGKLKRNRRKGTGKLAVTVSGPGRVVLSGKLLKKATVNARTAGTVQVPVAAKGRGLRALRRRGKLSTKARVAFVPSGGASVARTIHVKLLRKHG